MVISIMKITNNIHLSEGIIFFLSRHFHLLSQPLLASHLHFMQHQAKKVYAVCMKEVLAETPFASISPYGCSFSVSFFLCL